MQQCNYFCAENTLENDELKDVLLTMADDQFSIILIVLAATSRDHSSELRRTPV